MEENQHQIQEIGGALRSNLQDPEVGKAPILFGAGLLVALVVATLLVGWIFSRVALARYPSLEETQVALVGMEAEIPEKQRMIDLKQAEILAVKATLSQTREELISTTRAAAVERDAAKHAQAEAALATQRREEEEMRMLKLKEEITELERLIREKDVFEGKRLAEAAIAEMRENSENDRKLAEASRLEAEKKEREEMARVTGPIPDYPKVAQGALLITNEGGRKVCQWQPRKSSRGVTYYLVEAATGVTVIIDPADVKLLTPPFQGANISYPNSGTMSAGAGPTMLIGERRFITAER